MNDPLDIIDDIVEIFNEGASDYDDYRNGWVSLSFNGERLTLKWESSDEEPGAVYVDDPDPKWSKSFTATIPIDARKVTITNDN